MHISSTEFNDFYSDTRLGRYSAVQITRRVTEFWPDTAGLGVLGFGYAIPVLGAFRGRSTRILNVMPKKQGVMRWPTSGKNVSLVCSESSWPVEAGSIDRMLVLHGLETSENPSAVLDEAWRVMAPEGRALFIVPNRAGLWARREATPFGSGTPYTVRQLDFQLEKHRFVPTRNAVALMAPPSAGKFWTGTAHVWENIGQWMPFGFGGGVLLAEAMKRIYQPHRPAFAETVASKLKALEGMTTPEAKPVSGRNRS